MKSKIAIGASVICVALGVAGCKEGKSSSPDYQVRGTVSSKWIEYECKNHAEGLDFDPVSYVAKTSKPKTSNTKSGNRKFPTSDPAPSSPGPRPKISVTKVPTYKIPKGDPKKPKGYSAKYCNTEYELFILSGGDVYEQDVTSEHYEKCSEREKFPKCVR